MIQIDNRNQPQSIFLKLDGKVTTESNLILNSDFQQTSSNVISNNKFDATGSELLPEGASPMTGSWGGTGTIIDGKLVKNGWGIAYQTITYTEANSYKAIIDVESLDGNTTFWLAGTNSAPLVVGINTIYIVAGSTAGFGAGINDGYSSGEGSVINSISVKELGEDWTLGTGWSIGDSKAVCDGTQVSTSNLYQSVYTISNSYKTTIDVIVTTGTLIIFTGTPSGTITITSNGTHDFSGLSSSSAVLYIQAQSDFVGSVTNVTVQELGEDWQVGTSWSINALGAACDGTSDSELKQDAFTPQIGKTYRTEYTINSISQGTLNIAIGGVSGTLRDSAGTYVQHIIATLDKGLEIETLSSAIAQISKVSVELDTDRLDIQFTNQLTSKKFDFDDIRVLINNGRYSAMLITPPAETTPPSNAVMEEGMYLVTFKRPTNPLETLATRLAFVGDVPAFKEATYNSFKKNDETAYNVYING